MIAARTRTGHPCFVCTRLYSSMEAAERCEQRHDAAKAAAAAAVPVVDVTSQIVAQAEAQEAQAQLALVLSVLGAREVGEAPFLIAGLQGRIECAERERDELRGRVKILEAERAPTSSPRRELQESGNERSVALIDAIAERDRPSSSVGWARRREDALIARGLIRREGGVLTLTDAGREIAAARRGAR